jgi:hypothetical protein
MKFTIVCLLLAALPAFAQAPEGPRPVNLNDEFKIKIGQEVVVSGEKLRIEFNAVHSDSRCPTGVQCGWAGNAAIVIEVAKKNKKRAVAMLNTLLEPKEIQYKAYKIKLLGVAPYPIYHQPIDPKDYEATLVVTKE